MATDREKYHTTFRYARAKATRAALRAAIRPLASWRPIDDPQDGYTLVIATYAPLAGVLCGNFDLLARQDLTDLREVIVSMDAPASPELRHVEEKLGGRLPVPTRVLYRTPRQAAALRAINWGWVGCWLNYVEALAACRTRYALLHDMDAMLLEANFLSRRHRRISGQEGGGDLKYLAVRWYTGNGIVPEDRVGYIVNMALDVASLRARHRPIDLFNRVGRIDGRRVEWDTLLWPQQCDAATGVMLPGGDDWVHPSQVASQYMYLRRDGHFHTPMCNLPWIPYLLHLSGERDVLERHRQSLSQAPTERVPFLGGTVDLRDHPAAHTAWTAKQMYSLEAALFGDVRPEVTAYIEALSRHDAPERASRGAESTQAARDEADSDHGGADAPGVGGAATSGPG